MVCWGTIVTGGHTDWIVSYTDYHYSGLIVDLTPSSHSDLVPGSRNWHGQKEHGLYWCVENNEKNIQNLTWHVLRWWPCHLRFCFWFLPPQQKAMSEFATSRSMTHLVWWPKNHLHHQRYPTGMFCKSSTSPKVSGRDPVHGNLDANRFAWSTIGGML